MNPLIGFALTHAEQASLDDLETVGLQVGEQEEEAVFGCRQRAVLIDSKAASGPGFSVQAPRCHTGLEGRPSKVETNC